MNQNLPGQLCERLKRPLPGWKAQAGYQPEMSFGRHLGPAPADARPAAVLVLIYPCEGQWHVPLILRPSHMLDHAGQVSLPGGMIEPGETADRAALRECAEELGAPTDGVTLLGQLSELYLFASNFSIVPWVGAVNARPGFEPNRQEVERLLEVPVAHLVNPANVGRYERRQRALRFSAPCFVWESEKIWGATCMILAEFVAILTDCSP